MIQLSALELRILGALMEKERTTPDQYPLSLNALTNACNQKSNRDPVMELEEPIVQDTLVSLISKGLIAEVVVGSRVKKYRQRFGATEFSELKLSSKQVAILCVLFLRGPQTAGELRTRTNRLCEWTCVDDVEQCLDAMASRDGDAYVVKLPREPGKRECRYQHLFAHESSDRVTDARLDNHMVSPDERSGGNTGISSSVVTSAACSEQRMAQLEARVAALTAQVELLQAQWQDFAGE